MIAEIEEVYTGINEDLQLTVGSEKEWKISRGSLPLGIWFDKMGKFMVDEAQSKWAAHCQLQFSLFPVCILIPVPSVEYEISGLERPLLGVEAFDPGLLHAIDCQECRKEIDRLWSEYFAPPDKNIEQIILKSPLQVALVGLLHRCWPMAEAIAAMEANAAYLSSSGIRALLCSMIYAAMAFKSWEKEHDTEIFVDIDGFENGLGNICFLAKNCPPIRARGSSAAII